MDDISVEIDSAVVENRQDGPWLCFRLLAKPYVTSAACRLALALKQRVYDLCIKEHREKRSLDANAYAWVLLDKLAEKVSRKKEDVYKDQIANVGGNTETYCGRPAAVKKLAETWGKNGLGWICETMESKLPGMMNAVLYYGSSTFDTHQMHRFLDNIIQDCKAVGIETATPQQLALLEESWQKKN